MQPATTDDGDALEVVTGTWSGGDALVAISPAGVSAVLLGDDPGALRDDLAARFPGVRLVDAGPAARQLADAVIAHLDEPAHAPAVPLDLRGTPFQQAVWRALRSVPAGSTTTYAALAQQVGRPAAVRAVAQACAGNRHAVLVPCHRVVRSDGAISGYRWGVERKRALLLREGASLAALRPG